MYARTQPGAMLAYDDKLDRIVCLNARQASDWLLLMVAQFQLMDSMVIMGNIYFEIKRRRLMGELKRLLTESEQFRDKDPIISRCGNILF